MARIVARIVARMARIAKFGYRGFFSQIEYKSRGASTKDKEIGWRRKSRAERLKVLTRVDRSGRGRQGIARGSTKLVNDRLAAERHLLSRRKSLAVSQAARMPTVSAAELQAEKKGFRKVYKKKK